VHPLDAEAGVIFPHFEKKNNQHIKGGRTLALFNIMVSSFLVVEVG
jgi:hypothetical protein